MQKILSFLPDLRGPVPLKRATNARETWNRYPLPPNRGTWWNTKQCFHSPAVAEWVPSTHLHFSFSFWAEVGVVALYQQFWNRQFSNRLKGGISWSPLSSRWLFVRLFLLIAKDYWQKSSWTALVWSMTVPQKRPCMLRLVGEMLCWSDETTAMVLHGSGGHGAALRFPHSWPLKHV